MDDQRSTGTLLDDFNESVKILVLKGVERFLVNADGVVASFKHSGGKRGVSLTGELDEEWRASSGW